MWNLTLWNVTSVQQSVKLATNAYMQARFIGFHIVTSHNQLLECILAVVIQTHPQLNVRYQINCNIIGILPWFYLKLFRGSPGKTCFDGEKKIMLLHGAAQSPKSLNFVKTKSRPIFHISFYYFLSNILLSPLCTLLREVNTCIWKGLWGSSQSGGQ